MQGFGSSRISVAGPIGSIRAQMLSMQIVCDIFLHTANERPAVRWKTRQRCDRWRSSCSGSRSQSRRLDRPRSVSASAWNRTSASTCCKTKG